MDRRAKKNQHDNKGQAKRSLPVDRKLLREMQATSLYAARSGSRNDCVHLLLLPEV
jgi:hypothetical protein